MVVLRLRDLAAVQHLLNLLSPEAAKEEYRAAMRETATKARRRYYGKTVSICGQAPSVYPEFCEFLIKSGIDSISVNPDTVKFTKKLVAQVEQRVMLDALTGRGRAEVEDLTW